MPLPFYQNISILDFSGPNEDGCDVTDGDIRRAKLQSNRHHQQTNTHFYRPDILPVE